MADTYMTGAYKYNPAFDRHFRTLSSPQAAAWQERLERLRSDCGCRIGFAVMLLAIAGWIFYLTHGTRVPMSWEKKTLWAVVVLLAGATVGKIIGLTIARIRFHLAIRTLRPDCPDKK